MCADADKVAAVDARVVAERSRLVAFLEKDNARVREIEQPLADARAVVGYLRVALAEAEKTALDLQAAYIRANQSAAVRRDALTAIDAINSLI